MTKTIDQRLDDQNREFRTLETLIAVYKIHQVTAVVDDDYPEVRHRYEGALKNFLAACKENGR